MKNKEEKKEKKEYCSNCKFSSPSFNLLHCSIKRLSVGYNDKCDSWTKKHCKTKQTEEDDGLGWTFDNYW